MQTHQPEAPVSNDQLLHEVIIDVIPALVPNVDYTAAKMLSAELWASLDNGARRSIGRTLSRLVEQEQVPLVKTSPPYKMPVTYQRI